MEGPIKDNTYKCECGFLLVDSKDEDIIKCHYCGTETKKKFMEKYDFKIGGKND